MFAPLLALALHVLPRPVAMTQSGCEVPPPKAVPRAIDPGALDELQERWRALGIGAPGVDAASSVHFAHDPALKPQAYRLDIDTSGVTITSADADGAFYGVMTLAQLPVRSAGHWELPCVKVVDAPALRWRVLSDDVSRGPLPTMRYFEERIRTIAAFKMNGYSPYMEHVFASPTDPLPAWPDGITPEQLRDLATYAARFHVTLIPEQQTLSHMHNTLRIEQYAGASAQPPGMLIDPSSELGLDYLTRIIKQELAQVPGAPFFHIGSDEAQVAPDPYAAHIRAMDAIVAPSGARIMLWDDGIQANPSIMQHIPKRAVIVNWHYGANDDFAKFIATIANGGFEQMVAPGANNWNRIYPSLGAALQNEQKFIDAGKDAHVLGLFQTVWHDDGETLFEATWYPVLYAAADAWNTTDGFADDFSSAFFGTADVPYARDMLTLGALGGPLPDYSDKLEVDDPFGPVAASMAGVDVKQLRLEAEGVATDMLRAHPLLHANAAAVMLLAAQRYDALGRRYQVAREIRAMYADATAHPDNGVRDLFWSRYWFWELRDTANRIASLYAKAWRYEDREDHLASNLGIFTRDAQLAQGRADALYRATYDDFVPKKTLPPIDSILGTTP
jgi:hexosaminidase